MAHLETLEAKMANIEVSLCHSAPRRRKSTSASVVSGSASVRSAPITTRGVICPKPEVVSAIQDREAVIQKLRVQLGLGKLPRPSGTPVLESERPAAELRLQQLMSEAENKRIAIRDIKVALDKLDITDNIDIRIRQAELEYDLGRQELQLLSVVEEAQALQGRLDKVILESIFKTINSGVNLSLVALTCTVGRWAASSRADKKGLWIDWALEGEGLQRDDRLLEVNGLLIGNDTSKEEMSSRLRSTAKCQLVVMRKKDACSNQERLLRSQEDNIRLQHRILYLEEQVRELKTHSGETANETQKSGHVTSINITSPPLTPPHKPEVYQRGNLVMTIVDGQPTKLPGTETAQRHLKVIKAVNANNLKPEETNEKPIPCPPTKPKETRFVTPMNQLSKSMSASSITINSEMQRREKERKDRERELRREIRDRFIYKSRSGGNRLEKGETGHQSSFPSHEKRSRDILLELSRKNAARTINDLSQSVKSLDFDSDYGGSCGTDSRRNRYLDYNSDCKRSQPMPPKKPLRLSLQRAQSLQTVDGNVTDIETKKKGTKRTYRNRPLPDVQVLAMY